MSEFQIQSFVGNSRAREQTKGSIESPVGPILLSGPPGVGKFSWLVWHLEPYLGSEALTVVDAAEGIDQIREAKSSGQYVPADKYNAIVIRNLHRASDVSQDALLKSLEEPFPGTVFFLVCDDVGAVREPIVSRIRTRIHWDPLSREELKTITDDEFAVSIAFGSASACLSAVGDLQLRDLFDLCAKDDWPTRAISAPIPESMKDLESGSPRRLVMANVFRAAARRSKYARPLLRLSSTVARVPSVNVYLHYMTAAMDAATLL